LDLHLALPHRALKPIKNTHEGYTLHIIFVRPMRIRLNKWMRRLNTHSRGFKFSFILVSSRGARFFCLFCSQHVPKVLPMNSTTAMLWPKLNFHVYEL
jgi:hypothetical protein